MRGWPIWKTSSTAVIETIAPNEMIAWPQPRPASLEGPGQGLGEPFSCW